MYMLTRNLKSTSIDKTLSPDIYAFHFINYITTTIIKLKKKIRCMSGRTLFFALTRNLTHLPASIPTSYFLVQITISGPSNIR